MTTCKRPENSTKLQEKKKESPYKFDYYEQLLATPPMRISSKKANLTNRIIYVCIIVASITLLLWNQNSSSLNESDRKCLRDAFYSADHINGSADLGDSLRISFNDVQQTFRILKVPNLTCSFENISEEAKHFPNTVMMIQSRPESLSRRNILRETLMSSKYSRVIESGKMKFIFVSGKSEDDEKVNEILENEAMLYGDILITSLDDNYINLPYKSLQSFLFASSRCKNVELIGKIDEDVIFYADQFEDLLPSLNFKPNSSSILGDLYREGVRVNRELDSKWRIPKESFKCELFPRYMSGPLYFLTKEAAENVLKISKHRNFISVEDMFITGLFGMDIGAEMIRLSMMYYFDAQTTDLSRRQLLSWHNKKNDEQFRISFFYMMETRCIPCKKV